MSQMKCPSVFGTPIFVFVNHQGSAWWGWGLGRWRTVLFEDIWQNLAAQKIVREVYPLLPTECLIVPLFCHLFLTCSTSSVLISYGF